MDAVQRGCGLQRFERVRAVGHTQAGTIGIAGHQHVVSRVANHQNGRGRQGKFIAQLFEHLWVRLRLAFVSAA